MSVHKTVKFKKTFLIYVPICFFFFLVLIILTFYNHSIVNNVDPIHMLRFIIPSFIILFIFVFSLNILIYYKINKGILIISNDKIIIKNKFSEKKIDICEIVNVNYDKIKKIEVYVKGEKESVIIRDYTKMNEIVDTVKRLCHTRESKI